MSSTDGSHWVKYIERQETGEEMWWPGLRELEWGVRSSYDQGHHMHVWCFQRVHLLKVNIRKIFIS